VTLVDILIDLTERSALVIPENRVCVFLIRSIKEKRSF